MHRPSAELVGAESLGDGPADGPDGLTGEEEKPTVRYHGVAYPSAALATVGTLVAEAPGGSGGAGVAGIPGTPLPQAPGMAPQGSEVTH